MTDTADAGELSVLSESQLNEAKIKAEKYAQQSTANEAADAFAADMGEGEEDDEFQIDEDNDEYGYEDDDFGGADDFEAPDDENTKPYQNKLQAEVVRKKNTSISVSQAKLFGIPMDKQGNVKIPGAEAPDTDKQLSKILNRIGKMSDPVQSDLSHIKSEDDMESTFKPQKSAAALSLMRNPKLGYDFVDKLEKEKDGFLKRAFDGDGEMTSLEKIKKADAEEEYKISKNKLECPVHMANHKCRREQSFNEFWDKKRFCPQCQVRYVKLNVCDPEKFDRRMKVMERQRQERLKKVEDSMYNYKKPLKNKRPKDFAPDLPSSHTGGKKSSAGKDAKSGDEEATFGRAMGEGGDASAKSREPAVKSVGKVYVPAKGEKKEGDDQEKGKTEEDLSAELLEKLATLNSGKAALMNEVVAAAEDKVQASKEFDRATEEAKIISGSASRASSRATPKSGGGKGKSASLSKAAGGASSNANSVAASKGGSSKASTTSKGSKKSSAPINDKKAPPAAAALPAESKGGDKFDKLIL